METTIDSVIIDIDTSADNASKGLKNLINTLNSLNGKLKPVVSNLSSFRKNLNNAGNSINKLNKKANDNKGLDNLVTKLSKLTNVTLLVAGIRKLSNVIGSAINTSNEYIENLNLFYVSMGKNAERAKEFTDNFSEVLGVDPSNVMRYMGIFNNLAEGFGLSSEKAYVMSKNLTQLSYDMSSFLNIPIEQAMQKIKSGFSGEIEPMRAVGVALDQATLQETAYTLGLKQKVSEMTRAQKTQLLYYQMITKTTTMQGDMARTLLQPANAIRVLKQQFTQLARAIGNIFIPILTAAIPYVMVLTKWLTALAQTIANFFGFELPQIDTSNLGDVSAGIEDIEDSASGATKEMKKMLAPFDELNVIDFGKDSGSGSGAGAVGGELGIPLPEYDALTGALSKNLDEVEKKLKSILPYFLTIGAALLAWNTGTKIIKFLDTLGILTKMGTTASAAMLGFLKVLSGITLIIGGAIVYFQGFAEILDKTKNIWNALSKILIGIGVIMAGVLIVFGTIPALIVGAVLAVGALIGVVIRYWEEIKLGAQDLWDNIVGIFSNIGNWINEKVIQPIVNFVTGLWNKITTTIKNIWDSIVGTFSKIATWINEKVIQPVLSVVVPLVSKMKEIFNTIWQIIVAVFQYTANWVNEKIIQPIVNFVTDLWNKIKQTVTNIWNTIVDIFSKVANWININVISPVANFFSNLWNTIKEGVVSLWNKIVNTFNSIVNWIKNNVVNPIREAFTTAWNFVAGALGGIIKGVVNGVLSTVENFINKFIRGLNNVVNVVNKIPGVSISRVTLLSLPRFEDGGFPNKGQMFIANEAGPELIGNIGKKSAVANNDQIIEGIRQGVAAGVSEAMPNQQKGPINVYIGNKKVYSGYGEYANTENNMYGSNVIKV